MNTAGLPLGTPEDPADRSGAQRRHYVIFQAAGWGLFLTLQLVGFFQLQWPGLKPDSFQRVHPVVFILGRFLFPTATAFALTHVSRRLLRRLGWTRLDWPALLPRIFATGLILSFLLIVASNAFADNALHLPHGGARLLPTFVLTVVGNSFIFDGWLGAYFFIRLFERLNHSEKERLLLMASQKEAEFRALKSQVNPHFIFNSLNSLRSLIEEDPKRARVAVTQLANLLRYSLQSSQLETVPLEDELRMASDYLALEQVRYEDRLHLRIDVDPDALGLPVPPMLLQTLVENAVKYGIAQRREGGKIAIVARSEGDRLRLQVTNPRPPGAPIKADGESTGVGLNNAAQRLRLLFGEHATLRLRTDDPDLIVAEVIVPLHLSAARPA
jgi:signal transduction histidine kinase